MGKDKKNGFWKDFKSFITKGNVIDMAVGVVIGGSFGKIVTGLVNYIINPFVGIFTKTGGDLNQLKTVITPAVAAREAVLDGAGTVITPAVAEVKEVAILWGTWMQTIVDFLITAFCIFVVLRIIMKAKTKFEAKQIAEAKKKADEDAAKAEADKKAAEAVAAALAEKQAQLEASQLNQEKLLEQIRDLLKNKA